MATKGGFTILKWNGEYGNKVVFVVQDNTNNKQSLFTPGRMQDVTWVDSDLASDNAKWEDFEKEQVSKLEDIVF